MLDESWAPTYQSNDRFVISTHIDSLSFVCRAVTSLMYEHHAQLNCLLYQTIWRHLSGLFRTRPPIKCIHFSRRTIYLLIKMKSDLYLCQDITTRKYNEYLVLPLLTSDFLSRHGSFGARIPIRLSRVWQDYNCHLLLLPFFIPFFLWYPFL